MNELVLSLSNEQETVELGAYLARICQQTTVIYLTGDLGAGKTTLSRGFLQALGHNGKVKSPTYTLVEIYELERFRVLHFDLYRLADAEELEFIGIRDYQEEQVLWLVEWPDKGAGALPAADINLHLAYQDNGRVATLTANSQYGQSLLDKLSSSGLSLLSK